MDVFKTSYGLKLRLSNFKLLRPRRNSVYITLSQLSLGCRLQSKKAWKRILKNSIPGLELGSSPLKLVVTVPETCQSRQKGVELGVWGADDNCNWVHVTKHHLREALHINKGEMFYAADSQGGKIVISNGTDRHSDGNNTDRKKAQVNVEMVRKLQQPLTAPHRSPGQNLWGGRLSVWLSPGTAQCAADHKLAADSPLIGELIHACKNIQTQCAVKSAFCFYSAYISMPCADIIRSELALYHRTLQWISL